MKPRRIHIRLPTPTTFFGVGGLVLGVATLLVGVWIPFQIDYSQNFRANTQSCENALLALRGSMQTLDSEKAASDARSVTTTAWAGGQDAIDLVEVSCSGQLSQGRWQDGQDLWGLYLTADEKDQEGNWDPTNSNEITVWTGWSIDDLSKRTAGVWLPWRDSSSD